VANKTAIEVFGHPVDVQSRQAKADRAARRCRYIAAQCAKRSRLIPYPMGVCAVSYQGDNIALCPKRFLESETVFRDTSATAFGTMDNLIRFEQVKLGQIGSFDFVIVKHKPLKPEIEDFIAVEFQTGQTTGTGKLVESLKDFMAGQDTRNRSYNFGMNFYDIWKREFTQILFKGLAMERWGTKIFWIMQTPIFNFLHEKYHLKSLKRGDSERTVFALYDLKRDGSSFHLALNEYWSGTMDGIFHDLQHGQPVPSKTEFLKKLQTRVAAEMRLRLRVEST